MRLDAREKRATNSVFRFSEDVRLLAKFKKISMVAKTWLSLAKIENGARAKRAAAIRNGFYIKISGASHALSM